MFKFRSSVALAARINQVQNTAASRTAFQEGFQTVSVWNLLTPFNVESLERQSYMIEKRETEILTTIPEIQSCGQDIPTLNGKPEGRPVYFVPACYRVALKMCKDKCGPEDFLEKFYQAQREAGAGFGKILEQLLWAGDGFQGGITQTAGVEVFGAMGTDYENIDTQNAVEIANFFSMQIHGMDDPRMYMGPIQLELMGWREQSAENCSEVWQCVLQTLSRRFNETVQQTQARFTTMEALDFMTGINPNDPTVTYPTIMILDQGRVRMGTTNVDNGDAIHTGHDFAEAPRSMCFTTPQALREGAVRFSFGHIAAQKVADHVGTRFGNRGIPSIVVPSPIIQ